MTVAERQEIFAKECLTIKDIEKLFEVDYTTASKIIREIKGKLEFRGKALRLEICGKLHTQDYLDYVGATARRYDIKEGQDGKQQETCAS